MENPKLLYYLDDDNDDLHFFKEVAEALGHNVEIFINGQMMLKTLNRDKLPDVLFLDIRMPVYDGDQILQVIRKNEEWNNIPVVMISGEYAKSEVGHYLTAGANYIIKKPSSLDDLKSAIQGVLKIDWGNFRAYS